AAKYTPPVTPPTKKYSTIHQPQLGAAKEGLKSGGIGRIHPAFAERQHAGETGQNGGDYSQTAADGQVATGQVRRLGKTERRRCVFDQIERIEAAQHGFIAAVQSRLGVASLLQLQ